MANIVFVATHPDFIKPTVEALRETGRHEIKTVYGNDEVAVAKALGLRGWADLFFIDWCDNHLINLSRKLDEYRIVTRIHSYEIFTDMPKSVRWENVAHLIFVNETVQDLLHLRLGRPLDCKKSSLIYNGVDTQKFGHPLDKQYGKKVASVGYINYKKNPGLLLQLFKVLHDYDPEYTFHVAGAHQDPRIELYWNRFVKKNNLPVTMDGWIEHENMPEWYKDKDFIVSSSYFESFHYSIAEGMACGVLPLIHDWPGAPLLYPSEFLFTTPGDFVGLVASLRNKNMTEVARQNRKFIQESYNVVAQIPAMIEAIEGALRGDA